MVTALGELKNVDLRTAWPNEAHNFTPWLAEEKNLEQLGDALGLELELEACEQPVGPYWADIVALNVGTERRVVIENQLCKTDHDHLGKCLTYTAVLDATTVVWVAGGFSDEHKKTLDWLNENTSDEVSFFGVQLELWSIDGSRPAVRFNVVSHPADFGPKPSVGTGQLSETKKLQLEWWTALRAELINRHVATALPSAAPKGWFNVPLGRTGFVLSCAADTWGKRVGVRVYLPGRHGGAAALDLLAAEKEAIEAEVGESLTWNPNPDRLDKTIAVYRPADLEDRASWPGHLDWMVTRIDRLRKAFAPRIKALVLPAGADAEEAPA